MFEKKCSDIIPYLIVEKIELHLLSLVYYDLATRSKCQTSLTRESFSDFFNMIV